MNSCRPLLYGNPESGHSFKVKLFLELAGIEHDYEVVDIFEPRESRPEPFRSYSLSRFGEVPLLVTDGEVHVQSNAILLYLAKEFEVFGGENKKDLERATEWLLWEANKIGLSLPHLRLARNYYPAEFSEGAVDWLQQRYNEDSQRLEKELADGRPFILGPKMTIADLSLCAYLHWANQAGVVVPEHTRAWLTRISELPRWASPYRLLHPSKPYETFGFVKSELM